LGNASSPYISRPGCWAYPDMLEVGVLASPFSGDKGLTIAETRSHFAGWAIVSSPLTLSHDPNNQTIMDAIWPIISNKEVLEVSQSYAGFSGGPFKQAEATIQIADVNPALVKKDMGAKELRAVPPLVVPTWQFLYKPMAWDGTKVAVLLMNHDATPQDLSFHFSDVPGLGCGAADRKCKVRDVWAKQDLGSFEGSYTAKGVASHDSAFFVLAPDA
jgi:alpha-galactosidase